MSISSTPLDDNFTWTAHIPQAGIFTKRCSPSMTCAYFLDHNHSCRNALQCPPVAPLLSAGTIDHSRRFELALDHVIVGTTHRQELRALCADPPCPNGASLQGFATCSMSSTPLAASVGCGGEPSLVCSSTSPTILRFNSEGTFKILQIADMHYGNGAKSVCRDLEAKELRTCSDVNTTLFVERLLAAEKPDLVVFTGDNIDFDASNATRAMDEAFRPVIDAKVPWAAILGNHDHESNLPREDVMKYLTKMDYSLSQVLNPSMESLLGQEASQTPIQINGLGNYYLQVFGPAGSDSGDTSVLNLYFVDTGEYSKFSRVGGYDWIRANQIRWFQLLAAKLRGSGPEASTPTPALAFFHIPIPEYESVLKDPSKVLGDKNEAVLSPSINSGFFTALLQAGDVKATFAGHDHTNDYCGELMGIHLCYGGGAGYHAYGKVGWPRRARVVGASLKSKKGVAKTTQEIVTWKRLDDSRMSKIHPQILYDAGARKWVPGISPILLILLTLIITACSSCLFNTLYAKYRRKVGIDEYSRVTKDVALESNYPIDSDNSDDD